MLWVGSLMSQVLQWMQFWALICRRAPSVRLVTGWPPARGTHTLSVGQYRAPGSGIDGQVDCQRNGRILQGEVAWLPSVCCVPVRKTDDGRSKLIPSIGLGADDGGMGTCRLELVRDWAAAGAGDGRSPSKDGLSDAKQKASHPETTGHGWFEAASSVEFIANQDCMKGGRIGLAGVGWALQVLAGRHRRPTCRCEWPHGCP